MCPMIRETFGRNYDYIGARSFAYYEMICIVPGPGVLRIMLSVTAFNMTERKKYVGFFFLSKFFQHLHVWKRKYVPVFPQKMKRNKYEHFMPRNKLI